MKALVHTGPGQLELREEPLPRPGPGEVPVRVERVGICGSDMHAWAGHDPRRPPPLILGHEAAGVIASGPRQGERVTVNPLVTCGRCPACRTGRDNLCPTRQIISMPPRQGAFAEYLAIPERNLVTVPEGVSPALAALTEPLACGWHALRLGRAALRALEGEAAADAARVLVLGGGAIGLGAALAAEAQGCASSLIVEPNPLRRRFLAERAGRQVVAAAPGTEEFDIVVDAVGLGATRADASARVRPGGAILHVGLGEARGGLDVRRMTLQEIAMIGTYTYAAEDFRQTARAIFDGRLGPLDWTETRPLDEGAAAFEDIRAGRVAAPKILLAPAG